MTVDGRRVSAGSTVDDWCRQCKCERRHTVLVAGERDPIRVLCDTCGSQHNWRGGRVPRTATPGGASRSPSPTAPADRGPLPLVTNRELAAAPSIPPTLDGGASMDDSNPAGAPPAADAADLERLLRTILREEAGVTPVAPADKWRDGELVLRPGRDGLQEKTFPIETFFQKVVALRNRLRVLEQQINAAELPTDVKIKLQGYITACYGSLTSFNVLFAEEEDRFRGTGKGKS